MPEKQGLLDAIRTKGVSPGPMPSAKMRRTFTFAAL
jgi:hypothetical protein